MSIRFPCPACKTMLKIESRIREEKKVRCTTCAIVILVAPDPNNPGEVTAALPNPADRKYARSEGERAHQKKVALSLLGVLSIFVLIGLYFYFRAPANRASVEGTVLLDDKEMEKGTITFISLDDLKAPPVTADIVQGKYQLSARYGPLLGNNKVQINSQRDSGRTVDGPRRGEKIPVMEEAVTAESNTETSLNCLVQPGINGFEFKVKSRPYTKPPPDIP